jgi:hypothetical protein
MVQYKNFAVITPHEVTAQPARTELFYSYAREDKSLYNDLENHLGVLQRQGLITSWRDRQIVAGTDWAKDIDTHLSEVSIILLLMSSDFVASDYSSGTEIQRVLKRSTIGKNRVIPIVLRPVYWQSTPFGNLEALPSGRRPVTNWHHSDEAFTDASLAAKQIAEYPCSATDPYALAVLFYQWLLRPFHPTFPPDFLEIVSQADWRCRNGCHLCFAQSLGKGFQIQAAECVFYASFTAISVVYGANPLPERMGLTVWLRLPEERFIWELQLTLVISVRLCQPSSSGSLALHKERILRGQYIRYRTISSLGSLWKNYAVGHYCVNISERLCKQLLYLCHLWYCFSVVSWIRKSQWRNWRR